MKNIFRAASISTSLVILALLLNELLFLVFKSDFKHSLAQNILFSLIVLFVLVAIYGMLSLGRRYSNKFIIYSTFLSFLLVGPTILEYVGQFPDTSNGYLLLEILRGITGIILGIGLYRLKGSFGNFAKYLGILTLIEGFGQFIGGTFVFSSNFSGTLIGGIGYILIWFTPVIALIVLILNARLFFKAAKIA